MKKKKKEALDMRLTALYMRLSVDNNIEGEADSIAHQREILKSYAEEQGLGNLTEYIDQGISGTTAADRPSFQQMIKDVEAGKIGTILCKDLSRLFRNYLESGHYLEDFFPKHNVRVVAVTNHYDSTKDDDSDQAALTPIIAVFNQLYSRDVSKKIKVIRKELDQEGKPVGTKPPFGYKWNPDGSGRWVPDEEAAPTVRRIFTLFAGGTSMAEIARTLTEEGVLTPLDLSHMRGGSKDHEQEEPGHWNYSSVKAILDRPEYSGELINFRRRRVSYKDHRMLWNDKDEWSHIPGAHPAIVDEETYKKVRDIRDSKRKISTLGIDPSPLVGKVFCGDCGRSMTHVRSRNMKQKDYWICLGYRNSKSETRCTQHYITDDALMQAVLDDLRRVTLETREKQNEGLKDRIETAKRRAALKDEINEATNRLQKIQNVLSDLYEDKVGGIIPADIFTSLSTRYQQEMKTLNEKLKGLKDELSACGNPADEVGELMASSESGMVKKLTKEIVDAYIEKIWVKDDQEKKGRTVRVAYKSTGDTEVPKWQETA